MRASSRSKASMNAGISTVAVASAIARVNVRASLRGSKPCGSRAWLRRPSAASTSGHILAACAVGTTPLGTVTKSSSPVASRSRRSALLTAGCVIASCAAARVTLRSSITAAKTRSRLRSRVRKFIANRPPEAAFLGTAFTRLMAGFGPEISIWLGKTLV
jgi:hypothetical protein